MSDLPLFTLLQHIKFVLIEALLTAACIGFTPASSSLRWAGLPLVALCVWRVLSNCQYDFSDIYWIIVVASSAPICFLRYIDLVLVDRWEFESYGPTRGKRCKADGGPSDRALKQCTNTEKHGSFWERACFGCNVALSPRHLNTLGQTKNAPSWSDPMPSWTAFLGTDVVRVAVCYIGASLWKLGAEGDNMDTVFSTDKIPLIRHWADASMKDLAVRANSTWIVWSTILCIFSFFHALFGSIAVASRINKIEDWPPLSEAGSCMSTVRKFWG